MPEFSTDSGARLYYEVEGKGDGPALLFVHGWCSNVRHWDPQAEYFARRHRVLRVDRLGHGRSTKSGQYVFDFEHEAADIAQLAASVGVTAAVVIGHAAGIPTSSWVWSARTEYHSAPTRLRRRHSPRWSAC
jgi:pimeloyl-ACP methyl ester carboxylesterase